MSTPSRQIADFAAALNFRDIPEPTLERAKWLFLDWYGSAVAGSTSHSTTVLLGFAKERVVQWKMSLKDELYFHRKMSLKALILGSSEDDREITQPAFTDGGRDSFVFGRSHHF